jgi:hypothetical protein
MNQFKPSYDGEDCIHEFIRGWSDLSSQSYKQCGKCGYVVKS